MDAARRRWARGATLGAGAAAGALVGGNIALARQRIEHMANIDYRLRAVGRSLQLDVDQAVGRERAEQQRLRGVIDEVIRRRMAGAPPGAPRRDVMQTIQSMRNLTPPAPTGPQSPFAPAGQVGSEKNFLVYDFQIRRLRRRLIPQRRALEQMEREAGFESETPAIRRQRATVASMEREIADLENLLSHAPRPIGRRATTRQRRSSTRREPEQVSATTERKHRRGGETLAQVKRRMNTERGALRARHARMVENLEARTQEGIRQATARVHQQNLTALQDAIARGEVQSRIWARTGKGALIGAGLGFTLAGLGLLAHHVLTASKQRRVRKMVEVDDLQKATRSRTNATAARLAAAYRAWIDRLLGKTETPMSLGDDLTAAMAPGIAQDWADGYTNPPIDTEDSDPRYRIDVDFDVINPAVRRHMASYALDRIVDITQAQREAIRQALLQQSVLQGIGPYDVARTIRQSIGLTPYQQALVQSFRSQLVALDPRALNRNLRDKRFDPTLQRAIDTQTPLTSDQINQMEDAYHRKALALRAATIARTESIKATTYGGLARAQEVLDDHPELDVIKIWHSTHDDRTRDTHRDLDNKEVEGMQTNFVTSKNNLIRWPFDERAPAEEVVNCRCYLEYRFVPKRGQLMAVAV